MVDSESLRGRDIAVYVASPHFLTDQGAHIQAHYQHPEMKNVNDKIKNMDSQGLIERKDLPRHTDKQVKDQANHINPSRKIKYQ